MPWQKTHDVSLRRGSLTWSIRDDHWVDSDKPSSRGAWLHGFLNLRNTHSPGSPPAESPGQTTKNIYPANQKRPGIALARYAQGCSYSGKSRAQVGRPGYSSGLGTSAGLSPLTNGDLMGFTDCNPQNHKLLWDS